MSTNKLSPLNYYFFEMTNHIGVFTVFGVRPWIFLEELQREIVSIIKSLPIKYIFGIILKMLVFSKSQMQ